MNEKRGTQKQYPAAKRAWAERTGQKTIAIRLAPEMLARLERLAAKHGGRREAVEAGLRAIDV